MKKEQVANKEPKQDPFKIMEENRDKILSVFHENLGFDDFFFDAPFDNKLTHGFTPGFGNFEKMFENEAKKSGAFITQSYSNKTETGSDGKPVTEKLIRNETSRVGEDGKRISEKTELYNHTGNKIERVVKEREFGDQKVKVTKETKNSVPSQHRELVNLKEDEVKDFNKSWKKAAKKELLYRPVLQLHEKKHHDDKHHDDKQKTIGEKK